MTLVRRALLALALLWVGQVAAEAPAGLSLEQMAQVRKLLTDEGARAEFLKNLDALDQATRAETLPDETPAGALAQFLARANATVGRIGDAFAGLMAATADLPLVWDWITTQATDPDHLARWATLAWKIGAVLAVAWLLEWLVKRLFAGWRRRLTERVVARWHDKALVLGGRTLIDLSAVGAFAAGAYLTMPLVQANFLTQRVVLALVTANLIVRLVTAGARLVLAPGVGQSRLLPASDETATYLYVWLRRVVEVAVYGHFGIQVAWMLALSTDARDLLQRLLGLMVVAMLIMFVLQNRLAVAEWARTRVRLRDQAASRQQFGQRAIELWHLLAIAWLVAAYGVWALDVEGGFAYILRVTALSLALLVAVRWAVHGLKLLVSRGFAVGRDLTDRLPGLQARTDRYLPLVHTVLSVALYVVTTLVLAQIWGVDVLGWFATTAGKRLLASLVTIMVVLVGAVVAWEIVSLSIERYLTETDAEGRPMPRSARVRTLLPLMRNAFLIVLVALVALIVLSELGVNIAPLLAGAGVVGLAIGFGSQTLVRDVITGLFILFEDSIRVGDVVEVAGKSGTVEAITIRAIKLRDLRGNLVTVPFSSVSLVMNMTKDFSFHVFDIPVDMGTDVEKVRAILAEIDAALRADPALASAIAAPIEMLGIDKFDGAQVVLRGRVKTQPGKQWAVGRAFNLRLQERLLAEGVWTPPAAAPAPLDAAAIAAAIRSA
jgi:small conductance mechanosensitive channel